MEELVDDLVGHSSLLINTFGLEAPIHTQLLNLNTTLFVSINSLQPVLAADPALIDSSF